MAVKSKKPVDVIFVSEGTALSINGLDIVFEDQWVITVTNPTNNTSIKLTRGQLEFVAAAVAMRLVA
jgi:hypothetical protein